MFDKRVKLKAVGISNTSTFENRFFSEVDNADQISNMTNLCLFLLYSIYHRESPFNSLRNDILGKDQLQSICRRQFQVPRTVQLLGDAV